MSEDAVERLKARADKWHGGVATRSDQDGLLICDECGRQIGETEGYCWSCDDWRHRQLFADAIQALEASQQENERYRTAFDWEGMRSWAESVRAQWVDYEAKDDDSFAYPALKLADKILEGLAALDRLSEQDAVGRLRNEIDIYRELHGDEKLRNSFADDIETVLDALEASQQEVERLRGEYRRYLAFIVDFTTHYHRLTKSQRNAQIMQLRKDAKEKLEAALEEQEAQDEQ